MEKLKQQMPVISVAVLIVVLTALFAALPLVLPHKSEARAAIPVFRP
jgi:hypothetical protein